MIKYSLQNFSRIGEDLAARYLVTNGYSVVCRNYRKRCGEIDLIVEKDQHLIFCEVKPVLLTLSSLLCLLFPFPNKGR
jgi:putative endonuclease